MLHKLGLSWINNRFNFKNTNLPDYCELIVTEKCFFKCKMCKMWEREHEDSPTLDQWKNFVKNFRKTINPPFRIGICGGETLTYPHIFELIEYCSNLDFTVFITTNGFLLNKKTVDKLFKSGLKEIVISLDSLDESIHDDIRGVKGSYKKIMEALDILSIYNKDISVNLLSVIMSQNYNELPKIVEWVSNKETINSINFNAITEPLATNVNEDWYINSEYSYLWPKNSNKMDQILDKLIEMKEKNFKIGNSIDQIKTFKKYFRNPDKFVKNGICHMGNTVSVNSEGDIFMCHYYDSIGNIKNNDFSKVWTNHNSNEIRKKISECNRNCKMLINCNFQV